MPRGQGPWCSKKLYWENFAIQGDQAKFPCELKIELRPRKNKGELEMARDVPEQRITAVEVG